jgi:hypothetical protein
MSALLLVASDVTTMTAYSLIFASIAEMDALRADTLSPWLAFTWGQCYDMDYILGILKKPNSNA